MEDVGELGSVEPENRRPVELALCPSESHTSEAQGCIIHTKTHLEPPRLRLALYERKLATVVIVSLSQNVTKAPQQ